jgi:hypothetical protein
VKIVERLTKGESKKKKRNITHVASYIVMEVGGSSTFVTHDVTKVEVRWAEAHLKPKSHAPKERGRLTPRKSAGLSCQGRRGPWWARAGPGQGQGRAWASHGRGRALAMAMALVMAVAVAVVQNVLHSQFLMCFRFSIRFAF